VLTYIKHTLRSLNRSAPGTRWKTSRYRYILPAAVMLMLSSPSLAVEGRDPFMPYIIDAPQAPQEMKKEKKNNVAPDIRSAAKRLTDQPLGAYTVIGTVTAREEAIAIIRAYD